MRPRNVRECALRDGRDKALACELREQSILGGPEVKNRH